MYCIDVQHENFCLIQNEKCEPFRFKNTKACRDIPVVLFSLFFTYMYESEKEIHNLGNVRLYIRRYDC